MTATAPAVAQYCGGISLGLAAAGNGDAAAIVAVPVHDYVCFKTIP